ncbi:hypothetical protein [Mangrovihabitans endophyticus]|uniref:Uncharacterized protein n=1 Tax=Mangrovihabitans endophyticus TaxID=1751298 RepID=A0A8J3FSP8_9ACTN|nr:hypothetical protein [Mangrovihabitans endophyticus]GGL15900.1 hypothetical protein GCM10012284_58150 [Mangrovihabitans endophyticus]
MANWERRGVAARLRTETQQLLDTDLAQSDAAVQQRYRLIIADTSDDLEAEDREEHRHRVAAAQDEPCERWCAAPADEQRVRRRVEASLGRRVVAASRLDDWESSVTAYARAARYRPADELLDALLPDISDLRMLLDDRHTATSLRQTTRLIAQMAGLISLSLLKPTPIWRLGDGAAPRA